MISNLLKHTAAFLIAMTVALAFQSVTGINITGVTLTAYQGGSGDVVGPSSSVDSQVVQFNGTTGKLIKAFTGSGFHYFTSGVPVSLGGSGVVKLTSGTPSLVTGTSTNCVFVDGTSGSCSGVGSTYTAGQGLILTGTVFSVDPAAVTTFLSTSASLDFGSMASGRCSTDLTITLTGATVGDNVVPGWPATIDGGVLGMMWVSASDTIKVRVCNLTASSIDPVSQNYKVMIQRSF